MVEYVVAPPPPVSIAVAETAARFPVRRIFCVGRNYAAHAREMGRDPEREPPFFFTKPADAAFDAGGAIDYPPETKDLHHEIELVVAIGVGGVAIAAERALGHVFGYGVGIDLTRRDLQARAKELGRPWDWAKGFDYSAPVSPIRPAAAIGHPAAGRIWLAVDGVVRQEGDLGEMIWSVGEVIAAASRSVALRPGDLFMTGTPAGVGAIERGQVVTGGIDGVGAIRVVVR